MSSCSKAFILGGDSSGKVPGRALLCCGNPHTRKHEPENTPGCGSSFLYPSCSTINPPWSLCSFSLGRKGGRAHGEPTPSCCCWHCSAQVLHGVSPTYSVALALLRSWAQQAPESLLTRNHRYFCLLPLPPVACLTRKCCWGFLLVRIGSYFGREGSVRLLRQSRRARQPQPIDAQSTAARGTGWLHALEIPRQPSAELQQTPQLPNRTTKLHQFNSGLAQQRKLPARL